MEDFGVGETVATLGLFLYTVQENPKHFVLKPTLKEDYR